jgi:hypothetical protein
MRLALLTLGRTGVQRPAMTLAVTGSQGRVNFWLASDANRERRFAEQLLNIYPGSTVTPLSPVVTEVADGFACWSVDLHLTPDVTPLAPLTRFIDPGNREFHDPLMTLLTAVQSGRRDRVRSTLLLQLRPASSRRMKQTRRLVRFMDGEHGRRHNWVRRASSHRFMTRVVTGIALRFMRPVTEPVAAVHAKLAEPLFEATLRLIVLAPHDAQAVAEKKLAELTRSLNPFTTGGGEFTAGTIRRWGQMPDLVHGSRRGFLLTAGEAELLWHPPAATVTVPRLDRATMRELPPPTELASRKEDWRVTTLGRVRYRGDTRKVGLDLEARRRHVYLVGKTGVGKSTLLLNIVAEDLAAKRGVALIDMHGDLAEAALASVPPSRTNDAIYFDAGNASHGVAFNPLAVPSGADATLVADGVLAAFQKIFGLEEGNAPRLLHIFRNCLLTLVGQPGVTLLSVQRLLVDDRYRRSLVHRVMNPIVTRFWTGEFDRWRPTDRTEYIASLQNKLGAFTANERLQRILGQPENRLDLRQIMDAGQPLLVNLSKGRLGENAANLLGALLVSSLQLAAMSRGDVPQGERPDYSLVIDKFQNFTTPSIATLLSESRKFRVHAVLAHQYLAQLDERIRDAVIGNAGNMIAFQVGADDAEFFARQFSGGVTPDDLMNLPKYAAYARLLVDGVPSRPFSMTTILPPRPQQRRAELVRRLSRERYARPAANIDAAVRAEWT